jgi:hypothetical protein
LFLTHEDYWSGRDDLRCLRGNHLRHEFLSVDSWLKKSLTFRVEKVLINLGEL